MNKSLRFVRRIFFLLPLLSFIQLALPAQTVVFITPSGSGLQNGTSWINAFNGNQFQAQLAAAPVNTQFWVASGTYFPTTTANRAISFTVPTGVEVYGGFSGSETLLSQKNPATNVAILNGDIGIAGNYTDNSLHVVSIITNTARVDGVTIINGYADGGGVDGYGGGIYTNGSSIILSNLTVKNNIAQFGGGIFNHAGSMSLNNSLIETNTTFGGGGGLENLGSSTIDKCTFSGNIARSTNGQLGTGGAFQTESNTTICTNCILVNNSADGINDDGGGGVMLYGGTVNLVNCTLYGNTTASSYNATGNSISNNAGAAVNLSNTIVWGSATGHVRNGGSISFNYSLVKDEVLVAPNLTSPPQFSNISDLVGPDSKWGTSDDGLKISAGSPAKDAGTATGTPLIDIAGMNRPQGSSHDMGAFELLDVALPVNFISVSARMRNQDIQVAWELGTENDILGYEIENSNDGRNFNKIGTVAFNISRNRKYDWLHTQPSTGTKYYRVKAVEKNGSFKYSSTVKLNGGKLNPGFASYPNPLKDKTIRVELSDLQKSRYTLLLFNSAGQCLLTKQIDYKGGTESFYLHADISKGTYYLNLTNNDHNSTIPLVKN